MDYSDFLTGNNSSSNPNSTFSVKSLLNFPADQTGMAAYQMANAAYSASGYSSAVAEAYQQQQHSQQQQHGFPMDYSTPSFQYGNTAGHLYTNHQVAQMNQAANAAAFNCGYSAVPYLNNRTTSHHPHTGSSVAHLPLTSPHVQQLYDLKPPTTTALNAEALINELTSQSGNDKRK